MIFKQMMMVVVVTVYYFRLCIKSWRNSWC